MTVFPFFHFTRPRLKAWLTLLATACLLTACGKSEDAYNGPATSAKFFDAQFTDVHGKSVDLSSLRGKTVVVNFWSTLCPPCVEEMPMLNTVQKQWQDKNVVFVGIAADQANNVQAFLKQTPIDYRIVIAGQPGVDLARDLGNRYDAIPFTLIINSQQHIVNRHFGIYTREALEAELQKVAQ